MLVCHRAGESDWHRAVRGLVGVPIPRLRSDGISVSPSAPIQAAKLVEALMHWEPSVTAEIPLRGLGELCSAIISFT